MRAASHWTARLLCLCTFHLSLIQADIIYYNSPEYTRENLGDRPIQSYKSRPDLHSPIPNLIYYDDNKPPKDDEDYLFFNPHGAGIKPLQSAMIMRPSDGSAVWINHQWGRLFDIKVRMYKGAPHMTFWNGTHVDGMGRGYGYILNQHYETVAKIRTAKGHVLGDLHEFGVTDRESALIVEQIHTNVEFQGKSVWVNDGCFQDVDIDSGELLLEWCGSHHIDLADSYKPWNSATEKNPFDFMHLNSVDWDPETGNYLVSGRHTHAIYLLSPQGNILWTLGGKSSDFKFVGEGRFGWQHDARFAKVDRWDGYAISVFDNAYNGPDKPTRSRSRGLLLGLDEAAMTATVLGSYDSTVPGRTGAKGSMKVLPNEHALVGFGQMSWITEYAPDETPLMSVQYGFYAQLYRVRREPWVGLPKYPPALHIESVGPEAERVRVYSTWNGATEVDAWRITGSDSPLAPGANTLTECSRAGFETACEVWSKYLWVRAEAVAANGTVIGQSEYINRDTHVEYMRDNPQALEAGFVHAVKEPPQLPFGSLLNFDLGR